MMFIIFCVTFEMNWPILQADFSQYEKQIEVVVKAGPLRLSVSLSCDIRTNLAW